MSVTKMISCVFLAVVTCGAMTCAVTGQDPVPVKKADVAKATVKAPAKATAKNPKMGGQAKAGLDAAKAVAKKIKGLRGVGRLTAIEAAATAYERVASDFATDRAAVAVAGFEAGELWRRHGTLAKAEACYQSALNADDGRFRSRCLFQIGQMRRRTKQYDKAIESYKAAAKVSPQSNRAHDARLWVARTLQTKGETEPSIEAFRAAVSAAASSRQVIESSNYFVKALLGKGDVDGAGAAISHAEGLVQKAIAKGGPDSARLKKLLGAMSCRRAYQRAKDKAQGAGPDAVQLEKDRAAKK